MSAHRHAEFSKCLARAKRRLSIFLLDPGERPEFQLSEVAQKLKAEFGDFVLLDPVDSASPQGVWLSIRHRILRTPCVLIHGSKVFNRFPSYEELRAKILETLERSGPLASTRVSR